jgi:hypothetical protein
VSWAPARKSSKSAGDRRGVEPAGEALPEVSEEEARRRGREFIGRLAESEKKRRMLAVFDAYMDGKKSGEVAAAAGVSKGSVSGYLNEIEAAVECKIVRGRPEGGSVTAVLKGDSSLATRRSQARARLNRVNLEEKFVRRDVG